MREILFRAKAINRDPNREYRTDYKKGDWVYGMISRLYDKMHQAEMTNEDGVSGIDIDYMTIGQYTGLTNKNGNKIFEGDIVRLWGNGNNLKGVVEYDEAVWWVRFKECRTYLLDLYDEGEIIGNIYDNPELIGGDG